MSDMGCDSFERGERLAVKAERAKIANEEKDKQRQQHTQWVQHFSGQGEKWEVLNDYPTEFIVRAQKSTTYRHSFPKSEYRPCPPPEQWEVVKDAFVVHPAGAAVLIGREQTYVVASHGERFAVTINGALVLERKVEG